MVSNGPPLERSPNDRPAIGDAGSCCMFCQRALSTFGIMGCWPAAATRLAGCRRLIAGQIPPATDDPQKTLAERILEWFGLDVIHCPQRRQLLRKPIARAPRNMLRGYVQRSTPGHPPAAIRRSDASSRKAVSPVISIKKHSPKTHGPS